jgi:DDE superfamily endonuclease
MRDWYNLHGLLLDGERKSIEALSPRVPDVNEQNLQPFINQNPWGPAPVLRAYRAKMVAIFATDDGVIVSDDTGFAKQKRYSVGVARQHSETARKRANCQAATPFYYLSMRGNYPLALRMYLLRKGGPAIPSAWSGRAPTAPACGQKGTRRPARIRRTGASAARSTSWSSIAGTSRRLASRSRSPYSGARRSPRRAWRRQS